MSVSINQIESHRTTPLPIGSFYRHPGHKLDELRLLDENVGKIAKNGVLPAVFGLGVFSMARRHALVSLRHAAPPSAMLPFRLILIN